MGWRSSRGVDGTFKNGPHPRQLRSQVRSMVVLKDFFCGLKLLLPAVEILCCARAVAREKLSIVKGLKESVESGTLLSARNI